MALCKLHAVWFHEPRAFTPGIPVYFGPYRFLRNNKISPFQCSVSFPYFLGATPSYHILEQLHLACLPVQHYLISALTRHTFIIFQAQHHLSSSLEPSRSHPFLSTPSNILPTTQRHLTSPSHSSFLLNNAITPSPLQNATSHFPLSKHVDLALRRPTRERQTRIHSPLSPWIFFQVQ